MLKKGNNLVDYMEHMIIFKEFKTVLQVNHANKQLEAWRND